MLASNPRAAVGGKGKARGRGCSSGNACIARTLTPFASTPALPPHSENAASADALTPEQRSNAQAVFTLLDDIETSLHFISSRSFRAARATSDLVVKMLETVQTTKAFMVADKLQACSTDFFVVKYSDGYRLKPQLCRDRICPICQWFRALKLKKRFADTIKSLQRPKLLTLTIKTKSEPLEVSARRILKYFARLRRRAAFKSACARGFWVLEWTYNQPDDSYHTHLHCILDSHFIPHELISRLWHQITGDSYIVDIRLANRSHASYLAKYVAKNSLVIPPPHRLEDYINSCKSIRTYGSWGKLKVQAEPELELEEGEHFGLLSTIIAKARSGHLESLVLLSDIVDSIGEAVISVHFPDSPT